MEVKGGRPNSVAEQIDYVKIQARETMLEWSHLAIENIDAMADGSNRTRAEMVQQGMKTLADEWNSQYEDRNARIKGATVWASRRIDESTLNTANRKMIKSYTEQLFTGLANREDDRTMAISNSYHRRRADIKTREQASRQAVEERKAYVRTRLTDDTVLRLSVLKLEEEIATLTRRSGEVFGERERVIMDFINEQTESFDRLNDNKNAELISSIQTLKSQLEAKIRNTLQTQQAQEARDRQQSQQSTSGNNHDRQRDTTNNHKKQEDRQRPPSQEAPRPDRDPRISILMGKNTGLPIRPYVTVLGNIDHHRAKGKKDDEIYKILVRHFHPDVNPNHPNGEAILKVLSEAYDKTTKSFKV